jgi:hypothetical protein
MGASVHAEGSWLIFLISRPCIEKKSLPYLFFFLTNVACLLHSRLHWLANIWANVVIWSSEVRESAQLI